MSSIVITHPNSKGNGHAVELYLEKSELHGYVLTMLSAKQNALCSATNDTTFTNTVYFDWCDAIKSELTVRCVAQMAMVFRGEQESINCEKGICDALGKHIIKLSHRVEPIRGYLLSVASGDRTDVIFLSPVDAFILGLSLEQVMSKLTFGV